MKAKVKFRVIETCTEMKGIHWLNEEESIRENPARDKNEIRDVNPIDLSGVHFKNTFQKVLLFFLSYNYHYCVNYYYHYYCVND